MTLLTELFAIPGICHLSFSSYRGVSIYVGQRATNPDITAATELNTSVRTAASVERTAFYYESSGKLGWFLWRVLRPPKYQSASSLCEENTLLDFGRRAP
jgi:hypothetical protein